MELKEVVSSNVKAVGYEGGDLYVKYGSGAVYRYEWVKKADYEGLMAAESKGRFMNESIKPFYRCSKVK